MEEVPDITDEARTEALSLVVTVLLAGQPDLIDSLLEALERSEPRDITGDPDALHEHMVDVGIRQIAESALAMAAGSRKPD